MLDMGQCNDAYGAIQIAVALANAFKTDVNSLPLSFVVSWFEQKGMRIFFETLLTFFQLLPSFLLSFTSVLEESTLDQTCPPSARQQC